MKKVEKLVAGIGNVFFAIVIVLSAFLCLVIEWVFVTWPHLKMDELVYQLNAPAEGTNQDIIISFIESCIPGTVIILLAVIGIIIGLKKEKKTYYKVAVFFSALAVSCLIYEGYTAWNKLDLANYARNKNSTSSFIDENYVDASDIEITFPEEKRNLIYIFLESMETTYASVEEGGAFEEGCISELVELAQEYEDFSGYTTEINGGYSMPGTTWTMGGIFAQTSGLPLSLPIGNNNMDTQESFFPGITAVGDILKEEGYTQAFFIGSNAEFGGRQLYFTEHGSYEMKDLLYAREIGLVPENYYVWWGYEDKYLFEGAKEELLELSQQDEPFNFTMLTVDTHYEDGYTCSDCGTEYGEDKYANVMSCSSKKVKEFVEWIQQQDFYENTTIVICGDHPTMDKDFCEEIDSEYVRKTFTVFINSAIEPENVDNRREFTTFDYYPTTLASLGVEIEGDRLGLGTNLFSDTQTLVEEYGRDIMIAEVQKESELMNQLSSEINTEDEKLMMREGRLEAAEIEFGEYDSWNGYLPITIENIKDYEDGDVVGVSVAVWKKADQSDIKWTQATMQDDAGYEVTIDFANFAYETGTYQIHIYAILDNGIREILGTFTHMVE